MGILFYFSFLWLHVYAFAIHSKVHCVSAFELGASGPPYYRDCTPPVRVPAVLGALPVWRHNQNKTKNFTSTSTYQSSLFLFLGFKFQNPNLITGLRGWRTPLTDLEYGLPGMIFFKNHPARFFFRVPWGEPLLRGTQREHNPRGKPKTGGEVGIFGFYNKEKKSKQTNESWQVFLKQLNK